MLQQRIFRRAFSVLLLILVALGLAAGDTHPTTAYGESPTPTPTPTETTNNPGGSGGGGGGY
jgi:hypothetical protein